MKKYLLILFVLAAGISSCSKETQGPTFDAAAQAKIDDDAIVAYLAAHHDITAVKDATHPELYYQILEEGSGPEITGNSKLVVGYTGKTLNDMVFQTNESYSLMLSQDIIPGWKIGVPKIKNGGKILLIIPSALAYGPYANGPIPPNSVVIFTVTIKSVDGVAPVID